MARIRTVRGLTLIEMVVALTVIAIVAVMGSAMLTNAFRTYLVGVEADRDAGEARLALERITRELRGVRSATATDLTPAANQITFVDASTGATISYALGGTTLNRTETPPGGPVGTPVALADNVNSLAFTYFQSDGRSTTLSPTLVYYIEVQLTVNSQNLTMNYADLVKPTAF